MAVKSPCTGVCEFEGRTGYCGECLRTLDEARAWKKMTDHKRHQIINDKPRRMQKLTKATSTG